MLEECGGRLDVSASDARQYVLVDGGSDTDAIWCRVRVATSVAIAHCRKQTEGHMTFVGDRCVGRFAKSVVRILRLG